MTDTISFTQEYSQVWYNRCMGLDKKIGPSGKVAEILAYF